MSNPQARPALKGKTLVPFATSGGSGITGSIRELRRAYFNGLLTDEEFVNAVFDPQEQVNGKQAELLGAVFTLAAGGPAEVHVGTGSGGSSSDLPWGEQKKGNRR